MDAGTRQSLTEAYGNIAASTTNFSDRLASLVDEAGFDNLSPADKAYVNVIGETLGEVTIAATIAHEESIGPKSQHE